MKTICDQSYLELISNLRKIRNFKEISQKNLSLKLAKPQSYISKIECGDRRVDVMELINICACLEIKLSDLIPDNYKQHI